jgi:hypothetical protein
MSIRSSPSPRKMLALAAELRALTLHGFHSCRRSDPDPALGLVLLDPLLNRVVSRSTVLEMSANISASVIVVLPG